MPREIDPDIQGIVSLAQRYVRTPEGAKLYGKPVGTLIGDADLEKNTADRPVSVERLRSLQAQFAAAKRIGDKGLMRDIQEQFIQELRKFRESRPGASVLKELISAGGDQAKQQSQKDT